MLIVSLHCFVLQNDKVLQRGPGVPPHQECARGGGAHLQHAEVRGRGGVGGHEADGVQGAVVRCQGACSSVMKHASPIKRVALQSVKLY
jgi:hypothetical protein